MLTDTFLGIDTWHCIVCRGRESITGALKLVWAGRPEDERGELVGCVPQGGAVIGLLDVFLPALCFACLNMPTATIGS